MAGEFRIDPELEGVLRDVAADPRATLLRIRPEQALRATFEARPEVGAHATGLTAAERELVRVHRAEFAYLLRQACVTKLFEHPETAGRAVKHVHADLVAPTRPVRDVRADLEARLSLARCDRSNTEELRWIEALLDSDRGGLPSVGELAALSLRLEPTEQARIFQGFDVLYRGDRASARRVFEDVIARGVSRHHVAVAWANLAMLHGDAHEFESSLSACQCSTDADPELLMPRVSALNVALVSGNSDLAIEMSDAVQGLIGASNPAIESLMTFQRAAHVQLATHLPAVRTHFERLGRRLSPVADRLIHALL